MQATPLAAMCSSSSAAGSGGSSKQAGGRPKGGRVGRNAAAGVETLHGLQLHRRKLDAFFEFADESNDQLRLAAMVAARVLLAAHRIVESEGGAQLASGEGVEGAGQLLQSAMHRAALPFALGHKGLWWEVLTVPEEEEDGEEYRAMIK